MRKAYPCLVLVSLCLFLGCGGTDDKYDVARVEGTVTLDGAPVEGAAVSFLPQSEGAVTAAGTTDADGHYTLQTAGVSKRGAVPGDYKLTVIKQVHSEVGAEPQKPSRQTDLVMSPSVTTESRNVLPEKYATPAKSGLTATVKDSGTTTVDLALDSK